MPFDVENANSHFMFRKVTNAARSSTARARMRRGGMTCPDCGETIQDPQAFQGGEVVTCPACGARASMAEWLAAGDTGLVRGRVGEPPPDTRVRSGEDGLAGRFWEIPPSRRPNFFLFFALFWLAITALVSGGFLFAFLSGGEIEGDMPGWVMIPFFGVFWAIGLGVLYIGVREMLARHRITVTGSRITYRRELLGRVSEKSLSRENLASITQREFYQKNYRPVYGIEIRGAEGKIRFGSGLRDAEKGWLVAELEHAAMPRAEAAAAGGGALAPIPLGVTAADGPFSAVIPGIGRHALLMGLVLCLMSGAFIAIGFTLMADEGWIGFRGVWVLMSSVFFLAGAGMAVRFFTNRGKERRIEITPGGVAIRTYRGGRVLKDESFDRREVTDIRASLNGNSGGTPMKRVELIVGQRAVKLANWIDGDKADDLVREVRAALGASGARR